MKLMKLTHVLRPSGPRANPKRAQRANPGSAPGSLSVRLCPVGTVHIKIKQTKLNIKMCDLIFYLAMYQIT